VGTAAVAGNAQGTSQALFFWKGPGTVKVGEEFKVDLLMKSERPLRSLPLQLSFDPATLEVVRIEEGEFFKRGGVKTNFAHNIDQTNGRVFVGLSRAGAEGAKGEGGLVSVVFKSKVAKSGSEVRLIAATPVTFGAGAVTVTLPKPQVVSVNQ
jgi:general secretion pathway protein D